MIDVHTFLLSLGIGNIGFAMLMACYMYPAAPNPALRLWMWARIALGLTQLLGWWHPGTELGWQVMLEAIGYVVGFTLELVAHCLFFAFRHWRRTLVPMGALALLLVLGALYAGASYVQLASLVCVIIALFAAAMATALLRPWHDTSALRKLIGANDALFAVAMGLWVWSGADVGQLGSVNAGPYQAFAFVAGYLLVIVNGFGFLLLCKERDDAKMKRLATVDCLTGLLNRGAFFERAESARLLAVRMRKPISLLMLDLDHFKQLNDRFGHATGDEALTVFAATAREVLREHDIMGRLGGEEFALALPGTDLDGALQAAERLRKAVMEAAVITSGNGYELTVSIGVVLVGTDEPLTAALARADHALYAAKTGGRNRVEVAAPAALRA